MENTKKVELLAELFDMEEKDLDPKMVLANLENWDSMTKLSLIVMMDDECGKTLEADTLKRFQTVQDIMDYMG